MQDIVVDPAAHNRAAWDKYVQEGIEWSRPVSAEDVERARMGDWSIVLIGREPVDRSWLPTDLTGKDVLCLASGGGQQGPILAAAGSGSPYSTTHPASSARTRWWRRATDSSCAPS